MDIGHRTIRALVEKMEYHGADYADSYGEPGYQSTHTAGVFLGYYWCHCDHGPEPRDGSSSRLHSLDHHYPRLFAALEEQGYALEWHDEWWVDHETGKAWRTTADSYSWQPSVIWCEEGCDYLTPDHDIAEWIDWATADPTARCIPSRVWGSADIEAEGFVQWEPHDPHTYENGWHPGQDDNPAKIVEEITRSSGDVEILFLLDGVGQFDIRFSAYTRTIGEEADQD